MSRAARISVYNLCFAGWISRWRWQCQPGPSCPSTILRDGNPATNRTCWRCGEPWVGMRAHPISVCTVSSLPANGRLLRPGRSGTGRAARKRRGGGSSRTHPRIIFGLCPAAGRHAKRAARVGAARRGGWPGVVGENAARRRPVQAAWMPPPSTTLRLGWPLIAIFLGFIASGTSRTRSITSSPSSSWALSTRT